MELLTKDLYEENKLITMRCWVKKKWLKKKALYVRKMYIAVPGTCAAWHLRHEYWIRHVRKLMVDCFYRNGHFLLECIVKRNKLFNVVWRRNNVVGFQRFVIKFFLKHIKYRVEEFSNRFRRAWNCEGFRLFNNVYIVCLIDRYHKTRNLLFIHSIYYIVWIRLYRLRWKCPSLTSCLITDYYILVLHLLTIVL